MKNDRFLRGSFLLGTFLSLTLAASGGARADPPDVVVYGGGPGGITAAVAAARNGSDTLLLEPTRHVGGMSTSGVNTSELEHTLEETYGGLALEFYRRLGKAYGFEKPLYRWESHVAERVFLEMLDEAGVEVRHQALVDRVEKRDGRIVRLVLTDGRRVEGRVFVDATYEGDLMARAGVSYTFGREARSRYDEPLAGIRLQDEDIAASPYDESGKLLPGFTPIEELTPGGGDRKVMCYNFRLTVSRAPDRVPFPKPQGYDRRRFVLLERYLRSRPGTRLRDLIDLYPFPSGRYEAGRDGRLHPVPTDKWEVNNRQNAVISVGHFGGQFDYPDADHETRRRIVDDHVRYTQGFFHFLAHDPSVPEALRREVAEWGLAPDEYRDNGHWPYYVYVREARRMIGRHVMTQRDVQMDRRKEDAIALGSHWIDSHHVQRVAVSRTAFRNEGRIWVVVDKPYQVPYRSLTPKREECLNLLVPVCVSASHVAFCSIRVESTWMMLGHATGTAAALCVRRDSNVQDLPVPELRKRLRQEGQVIDLPSADSPAVEVVIGARSEEAKSPLHRPFGVDFDAGGRLYIVELEGGRVHVRSPSGELSTIAGDGTRGYAGDGGPASEATFNGMHNVAVMPSGDAYIADSWNHVVRKIDGSTGRISTFAGTGKPGFSGDGGPAAEAEFDYVMCVTLDPRHETLHLADLRNRRVRAIDLATGIVRTIAGNGEKGVPADGSIARESPLVDPRAVAADSKGNVYILERGGHSLRAVDPSGRIRTVVGTAGKRGSRDGPARDSRLDSPKHIAVDSEDRILIADDRNGLIRRYDPRAERVTTVLGRDDGVELRNPHGVCFERGAIWVVDTGNDRILRVTAP